MDFDIIFLTGPQGCGKGTQGRRLAEKLGFFFWDTGAVLREVVAEGTDLGKRVGDLINNGIFLPDEMLIEVAEHRLLKIPEGQGIIFDGVPRRIGQANFLLDFLANVRKQAKMVTLLIDLPREESLKRILRRAEIEKRVDDTPAAIEKRLNFYEETIKPTIDFLKTKTTFIEVDGRPPVEEVAKAIDAALDLS